VAGCCECGNELWVTHNAVNYLTILGPVAFLGRTLLHGVSFLLRRQVGSNLLIINLMLLHVMTLSILIRLNL
jgi:hypothetical protein